MKKPNLAGLNTTAYRIFKLLEWLIEAPLTVKEMNQHFLEDEITGKALSEDSLWLYINTLKHLGCDISRPAPSNGYKHVLNFHPFGVHLEDEDIEVLVSSKTLLEQCFTYDEMLELDGLFRKLLLHSNFNDREAQIERFF